MIEIHGPTYRYQGEELTAPDVVYVVDHHYDEENQRSHVVSLIENSRHQHLVVFDHINRSDLVPGPKIHLPLLLAAEAREFTKQRISVDWQHKTNIFNFMINKPRPHREFLLALVEHFGLSSYRHSLCWKDSIVRIRATDHPIYQSIIDQASGSVPCTNYVFGPETKLTRGVLNGSFPNSETYQGLLQQTVFEPTCISLITEPCFYESETLVTEKTIMSIYGGTLPIWVGGWRIPSWMRSQGFDVFDDMIDHSYESLEDPWDRCYYAIEKNLRILTDSHRAFDAIKNNQLRLENNLRLMESNPFLRFASEELQQAPAWASRQLTHIVENYRGGMFAQSVVL